MADHPTKASDVNGKKSAPTKSAPAAKHETSRTSPSDVTGRTVKSEDAAPKPGEPIDNPTASADTGQHPEPTKKNESTSDAATGEPLSK